MAILFKAILFFCDQHLSCYHLVSTVDFFNNNSVVYNGSKQQHRLNEVSFDYKFREPLKEYSSRRCLQQSNNPIQIVFDQYKPIFNAFADYTYALEHGENLACNSERAQQLSGLISIANHLWWWIQCNEHADPKHSAEKAVFYVRKLSQLMQQVQDGYLLSEQDIDYLVNQAHQDLVLEQDVKKQRQYVQEQQEIVQVAQRRLLDDLHVGIEHVKQEQGEHEALRGSWLDSAVADNFLEQRLADRERALKQTESKLYAVIFSTHMLTQEQLQRYRDYEGDTAYLSSRTDSPIQHQLHKEFITTIEDTIKLQDAFGDALFQGSPYALLYRASSAGLEQKSKNNIPLALAISDFCTSFYASCKQYAIKLGTAGIGYTKRAAALVERMAQQLVAYEAQEDEVALRVADKYGRVAVQSLHLFKDSAKQQIKEALQHPLATSADIALLFTAPSLYLAKAMLTAYQNSDAIKQAAVVFGNLWRNHPEHAAALTTALVVDFVLTDKLLGCSSKVFDKMAAKVCTLGQQVSGKLLPQVQREVAFAGAAGKLGVQVTNPLSEMGKPINNMLLLAEKEGADVVGKAITTVAKDVRVGAERNVVGAVERAAWEASRLSKNVIKHTTNRHLPEKVQQEISFKLKKFSREYVEADIAKRSYFNKDWTLEQVENATKMVFDKAVKAGVKNGEYSIQAFGEKITIYFENGILQTIYGNHKYTLSDFGY